ncbi:tRNA threonylcarbamoyladenosine biosynthesis protein TsaE (modular protein) [Nitrospira lenta]|uniref:tRNA threonylcarbamoyladenosine biosynthesis protein TsaE n=1 Tax=Nitrospira lenta TaxID=1436998 RepID=A0A330L4V5_9BACT|nr:tRNA threonylcarbamoyladenosine biosynthesis protein TsaE (modular protein) [Nitrospira lenta]
MRSRTSAQRNQPTTAVPRKARTATQPRPVSPALWTVPLPSRIATEAFGRIIGQSLAGGETLALSGELGAGKTALVRGIAAGLGMPPNQVTSPTFVLIHEYAGRLPLIHVDLYRLRSAAEAEGIGLQEYFQGNIVTAIEWADKFPDLLPSDRFELTLQHNTPTTRTARMIAHGPRAGTLFAALKQAVRQHRRAAASTSSPKISTRRGRPRTS